MSDRSLHCIVIGAGTVGASCAWYLRSAGHSVTLVDHEDPGQSTSFGNAGCISPNQITPFSYPGVAREVPGWLVDPLGPLCIRWRHLPRLAPWFWRFWRAGSAKGVRHIAAAQTPVMRRVVADFEDLVAATDTEDLRRARGMINLYDTTEEFHAAEWKYELMTEFGFEWQILSPAELRIMAPELQVSGGVALYYPEWQHLLDPGEFTARVAEAAFAAGADWLNDSVTRVSAGERRVAVETMSGRRVEADRLVIAAGVVLVVKVFHEVPSGQQMD